MVTAVLDASLGMEKERLMALLSERGIDSRPFFYPLSSLPAYEHLDQARQARRRNRVSYEIGGYGVDLRCSLNMKQEKVRCVRETLKEIRRR